jgi:hypothetical protein
MASFLKALNDADAGATLYRLHSPDAPIRDGEGTRLAAEVDAAAFAANHRELALQGGDALPKFVSPKLLEMTDVRDEAGVAWFEITETRSDRSLTAALGVQVSHGSARVGWCTLASRVASWSYRDGLLQSLADYPWMRTRDPARARALLDASYFRRHWRSPASLSTLPDARFSCQMSTACCRHDFEIVLPAEAQLVIDAVQWQGLRPELAGTQLPVRPDGKLQLKTVNETCRFLGERRLCLIHQTLGRQPFAPCAIFPFAFAQTPEGIAVSLSPICGATRLGLGVAPLEREADLRERLAWAEPRQPNGFRLTPDRDIGWAGFRDIEKGLRDCLAAQDLPLRRRLYMGSRLLGALSRGEPVEANRWLSEAPTEITGELRAAIRGMLTKILGWDRTALRGLAATLPPELWKLEVRDAAIVVRILQNVVFSKAYSYPYDLTTAHNFVIVLYLLTLVMQAAFPGPLPDAQWQELGSLGVHGLLKSILHEGVPEGFQKLFGTSEFGLWALAV